MKTTEMGCAILILSAVCIGFGKPVMGSVPPKRLNVQPVRSSNAREVNGQRYDLVVVGGTPGGIACAVRAAREGLSVLLVQHNRHLGGMLSNGLMQWDALYSGQRAPIFNEIAKAIEAYYRATYGENSAQYDRARFTQDHYPLSNFEPSVAEHCLNRLVSSEPGITTLLSHIPVSVAREGALLKSLTLREYGSTNNISVYGRIYVDATYEGDLAAEAGVPCRVGREGRDETGEPHAGVVFTDIEREKGPQDAVDGRLNIRPYNHRQKRVDPESPFTADNAIQAYNYRFCLSSEPENLRLPEKPAGYDRSEYIHYNRKGMGKGVLNGKATFNNAILPGENHDYPEADWPMREKIIERHKNFALGLMYFLQNDPSVPEGRREYFQGIGLPLDEYTDNDNIPYEMYVREARRIVGRFLFREQDNVIASDYARTPVFADSVAITDWSMDSHACTTNTRPGFPYDGKLILAEESRPAQIPYRTLLPQGVDNLLVPVCLSATHVAWGAVRLEPVWIQTGEAAGFAAALAMKEKTTPAALDSDLLIRTLVKNHFMVSFFNDVDVKSNEAWVPAVQYFGTRGFFASYDAKPDALLSETLAEVWARGFVQLRNGKLDPGELAREVAEAESNIASESVTTKLFLAMMENTKTSHNADPLKRKTACRLMFKILER
ncbi:MAG: FAD-dependent oxidoreductase [Kiritimatiellae bacterium]|nr:FAD-dependent oxidoreductase [Kiritimatiellia bacterium]